MFKFKKTLSLALILCFMVTLLVPITAFAKERERDFSKLEKIWSKNGIDKNTQAKLKDKIKKGKLLDSQNPEKVKVIKDNLKVSKDNPYVKHTFEDGSVIVLEMKTVDTENIITPMGAILNETLFLKANDSYMQLLYYADVTIDANYPNSKINTIYDQMYTINLGTITEKNFAILNKYETSSKPARAELACEYTVYDGGQPLQSGLARLELTIENSDVNGYFTGADAHYNFEPTVF